MAQDAAIRRTAPSRAANHRHPQHSAFSITPHASRDAYSFRCLECDEGWEMTGLEVEVAAFASK